MNRNKICGLIFMISPVVIFLTLMLLNMPHPFDHCWLGCGTDRFAGLMGIVCIIIGIIAYCEKEYSEQPQTELEKLEETMEEEKASEV